MQGMQNPWEQPPVDPAKALAALQLFPAGSELDPALRALLEKPDPVTGRTVGMLAVCIQGENRCAGLHIDLDADGTQEFVLLLPYVTQVFQRIDGSWRHMATSNTPIPPAERKQMIDALQRGQFAVQPPRWPSLRIGEQVIDLRATAP
jgi:hypothetical protein